MGQALGAAMQAARSLPASRAAGAAVRRRLPVCATAVRASSTLGDSAGERVKALPKHGALVADSKVTVVSHTLQGGLKLGSVAVPEGNQVFAVVTVAGTQFKVSPGDRIVVNKIDGQAGELHEFEHVLLVGTPTKSFVGRPVIPNAKVTALIEEQTKDAKLIVLKRQPKTNSRSRLMKGHRRKVSFLRIKEISYDELD